MKKMIEIALKRDADRCYIPEYLSIPVVFLEEGEEIRTLVGYAYGSIADFSGYNLVLKGEPEEREGKYTEIKNGGMYSSTYSVYYKVKKGTWIYHYESSQGQCRSKLYICDDILGKQPSIEDLCIRTTILVIKEDLIEKKQR